MSRKLSDTQLAQAADMRERGLSCGQIAVKFGVSSGTISWWMLRLNADPARLAKKVLPQRRPGPDIVKRGGHEVRAFNATEDALILQMACEGHGPTAIGRRLGRRQNSIRGRLMTLARHDERRGNVEAV